MVLVDPTITKILETIIRERIKPFIQNQQNSLPRGFTEGSSQMNCSLILEESIRNNKDNTTLTHIAFLDSKSAFGVVSHASLMRKLFHIGVEENYWNLINSLHSGAQTEVKWNNRFSDSFEVQQGVRQGGSYGTIIANTRSVYGLLYQIWSYILSSKNHFHLLAAAILDKQEVRKLSQDLSPSRCCYQILRCETIILLSLCGEDVRLINSHYNNSYFCWRFA